MAYTPNVPKGRDVRSETQPLIKDNFIALNDFISVDHTDFTTTTPGLHKKVTFTQQTNDPQTSLTQMALYAKKIDDDNITGLFARYPGNGRIVQVDGSSVSDGSGGQIFGPSTSYQGWQYLSGGILMKWGYSAPLKQAFGNLTYPYPIIDPIPAFKTTPFHMEISILASSGDQVFVQPIDNLTYSVFIAGSTITPVQFYWMALGT